MNLNSIINQRIGFGTFQIRAFLILCLIDMNDGVELVLSSFLNPIMKAVFPGATSSYVSAITSIFYLGILCGSITSGQLADKYGRRRLIRYGALMQLVVALLFYLANSLTLMFLLRFIYGFSFGFTIAITTSMFAEITP
jgi:MFS transporter, putative metabolite:H+ symporter